MSVVYANQCMIGGQADSDLSLNCNCSLLRAYARPRVHVGLSQHPCFSLRPQQGLCMDGALSVLGLVPRVSHEHLGGGQTPLVGTQPS